MPISGPVVHQQLMDAYSKVQADLESERNEILESKDQRERKLDIPGAVLGSTGLAALIFGNWRPGGVLVGALLFGYVFGLDLKDLDGTASHAMLLVNTIVLVGVGIWALTRRKTVDAVLAGLLAIGAFSWYLVSDTVPDWWSNILPYVLVLPYPDPQAVWPQAEQAEFARLAEGAQDVITLQKKAPEDKQKARGAIGRRDAWFARNAKEAVIVWDNEDADVGRLVRSMQDALGELDVWVLDA